LQIIVILVNINNPPSFGEKDKYMSKIKILGTMKQQRDDHLENVGRGVVADEWFHETGNDTMADRASHLEDARRHEDTFSRQQLVTQGKISLGRAVVRNKSFSPRVAGEGFSDSQDLAAQMADSAGEAITDAEALTAYKKDRRDSLVGRSVLAVGGTVALVGMVHLLTQPGPDQTPRHQVPAATATPFEHHAAGGHAQPNGTDPAPLPHTTYQP
jgi:hypothetical protein